MFKLQVKKVAAIVAITATVALGGVFANAGHAAAYSGNVNLQFGNWHCPSGGSVIAIEWVTVNPAGYGTGWTNGSKASVYVWMNTRNTAYATLLCHYQPYWYMPWYWVNVPVSVYGESFWPSYTGQTFWL